MPFPEVLQAIQAHFGLSGGQMATAFGMSRQGYRQMLLRNGRPSFLALQSFLMAVPVDANFLLLGQGGVARAEDTDRISALETRLAALEAIIKSNQP